ncbi:E3 binding domain-containing protein, partial [Streptomyces sp. WG7]|uniref:E3 binding domain-containing protein n=1 Tax=Streptomyces sp. WG7 TaxID=3417650 RepID=UPI003CF88301
VVRELHFPEGTTVDVGTSIIAVADGGTADGGTADGESAERQPEGRRPVLVGYGVSASATRRRPRKGADAPPGPNGHDPAGAPRPLAKPPVRKLAKDLGVDLTTVLPSGPDGVITREDVHAAAVPHDTASDTTPVTTPDTTPDTTRDTTPDTTRHTTFDPARETRIPVKGVRKATAAAMVGSAFTA